MTEIASRDETEKKVRGRNRVHWQPSGPVAAPRTPVAARTGSRLPTITAGSHEF